MDEVPVTAEVKQKRKYTRKAFVGVEVSVSKKRYRGDTYQLTPQFLVVSKGTSSTYIALGSVATFEINDTRLGPRNVTTVYSVPLPGAGPQPQISGGLAVLTRVPIETQSANRNRELDALMNGVTG